VRPDDARLPPRVAVVLDASRRLAAAKPGIVSIGLAGSWARGAGRPDSDVDLVVLTTQPLALLTSSDWYELLGSPAELIRCAGFGAVQERRIRLADGLQVEVGVGVPSWADTTPVDPGTRRVVADGMRPIYDPTGLLARLIAVVNAD
jgi:uncharacterized protein